jgi:hypothetical protein
MVDNASSDPPSNAAAKSPAEMQEDWAERIKIFDRDQVSGRYCAFIDILGFGAATENDLPSVLTMYEVLLDNVDYVLTAKPPVQVTVYSDSFILVSPILAPLIASVRTLLFILMLNNCLSRGGIAYGEHAEGEKAGTKLIISAGISKAVKLEKEVKWPCVALHPDLPIPDEAWGDAGRTLLYFDGLRIVNPFSVGLYKSAGGRVRHMKNEHPEHSAKYDWFLRLFEAHATERLIPEEVIERLNTKYPGWDKQR